MPSRSASRGVAEAVTPLLVLSNRSPGSTDPTPPTPPTGPTDPPAPVEDACHADFPSDPEQMDLCVPERRSPSRRSE